MMNERSNIIGLREWIQVMFTLGRRGFVDKAQKFHDPEKYAKKFHDPENFSYKIIL